MKKLLPLFLLLACHKSQPQTETPATDLYESVPVAVSLSAPIKEASGIATSKSIPGSMWVEQDSGNPPMLYLLQSNGVIKDSVMLTGASNRDWEDVVLGSGPDQNKMYLYVGEIGDNDAKYNEYSFYRFEEPVAGVQSTTFDNIRFTYSDGSHDAEAFVVEKETHDIYIITKRDEKSKVFKLAYPQSTTSINEAELVMSMPFNGVVSAAVSTADDKLLLKTYTQVYLYTRKPGEDIAATLSTTPTLLSYQVEPQGEAICFAQDGSGFYTLSEEALGVEPKLNFYKKKP